ncbi:MULTISPECIES: hypothetical protein [Mameliella]|uniref:hypothetical protein n=1 Tax=Mameliella TaxID=1434019 RepID=UPI000B5318BE|nr:MULTISPECIES: hypothetical protein [Mameliella]MCR9273229.1 hypothetical protein [Paracoccaceae bacterium]OWV58312.1 hypothetical protein CDZ98_14930 [Mameliella alba]
MSRSRAQVNAILLVGDHHWRKGPKWRAALAWCLGRREVFVTHLGDAAKVRWWRGEPYLVSLRPRRPGLPGRVLPAEATPSKK